MIKLTVLSQRHGTPIRTFTWVNPDKIETAWIMHFGPDNIASTTICLTGGSSFAVVESPEEIDDMIRKARL